MGNARSAPAARLLVLGEPVGAERAVIDAAVETGAVDLLGVGASLAQAGGAPAAAAADALLVCAKGPNGSAGGVAKADVAEALAAAPNVRWVHSASAGVNHLLVSELLGNDDIVLTNAKGVYSHSLAEFACFGMKWFALDIPRLMKAKADRRWSPADVGELRGGTLGVVGLGDIGSAVAKLAKAHGMTVVGLRRRKFSRGDRERLGVDEVEQDVVALCRRCDFVCVATPATPATTKLLSREAIAALPSHAVVVNVGRGVCIDEEALAEALAAKRIRGAALDVFAEEPLPPSSPLWSLDNVLITPHCADRTDRKSVV